MKLEVGMYVRTKHHGILKYGDRFLFDDDILKASHNTIDLIEVGDYVNGHKVTSLWKDKGEIIGVAVDSRVIGYDAEEIKSIVTKEQFESMKYSLEG